MIARLTTAVKYRECWMADNVIGFNGDKSQINDIADLFRLLDNVCLFDDKHENIVNFQANTS